MNKSRLKSIGPRVKSLSLIISLLVLGLIIGIIISTVSSPYLLEQFEDKFSEKLEFELTEEKQSEIVSSYSIMIIILCINITLLFGLLFVYIRTYRRTKSRYLIGFSFFIGVLLTKSLAFLAASTPLITEYVKASFGYIGVLKENTFGPFGIYFTFFEIFAMCILLYLSTE